MPKGIHPRKWNDLTGKTFNRLTCLKFIKRDKKKNARYLWKCKCGKIKEIDGTKVKNGHTKSCGCLGIERRKEVGYGLPKGEACFNMYYKHYVRSAERKNREFKLTKQQFRELTKQNCTYCNNAPRKISKNGEMKGHYYGNGIDRKDNTLGYTVENSIPCCKICNYMKSNYTIAEFKEYITNIYNYWINKMEL